MDITSACWNRRSTEHSASKAFVSLFSCPGPDHRVAYSSFRRRRRSAEFVNLICDVFESLCSGDPVRQRSLQSGRKLGGTQAAINTLFECECLGLVRPGTEADSSYHVPRLRSAGAGGSWTMCWSVTPDTSPKITIHMQPSSEVEPTKSFLFHVGVMFLRDIFCFHRDSRTNLSACVRRCEGEARTNMTEKGAYCHGGR